MVGERMEKAEEWRAIEEFKGFYEVSNLGRVRSIERYIYTRTYPTQIMKPFIGNSNSVFVQLRNGKKQVRRSVAKLVLLAFKGPPPKGSKQVKHIDGDTNNNALDNLKWDVCKATFLPPNKNNIELFNSKAEYYVRKYLKISNLISACRSLGYADENDIVQDALYKIWRHINAFDPRECEFSTFCYTKTKDVFLKAYKKEIKKKENILNIDIHEINI